MDASRTQLAMPAVKGVLNLVYSAAVICRKYGGESFDRVWREADADWPTLFRLIDGISFPKRRNLQSGDEAQGATAMSYGVTTGIDGTVYFVGGDAKVKALIKEVARQLHEVDPWFCFSSLQVNKLPCSALHIDPSNVGPSYVRHFGPYRGGFLWLHQDGGRIVEADTWARIDGKVPRFVFPFAGERFSVEP